MSIAATFEPFDRNDVFCDDARWAMLFDEALTADPELLNAMGWLLCGIIKELQQPEDRRARVINTAKLGLERLYRCSRVHLLSFLWFLYQLEALLAPEDLPEPFLMAVIGRAEETAAAKLAARPCAGAAEIVTTCSQPPAKAVGKPARPRKRLDTKQSGLAPGDKSPRRNRATSKSDSKN